MTKRLIIALVAVLLTARSVLAVDIASGAGFGSSNKNPYFVKQVYITNTGGDMMNPNVFWGYQICSSPAVSGLKSVCQLVNPAGSGVWVAPNAVSCWVGTTSIMQLTRFDTPRTTSLGGPTGNYQFATAGAASHMQFYSDAIAANGVSMSQSNVASTVAGGTGLLPTSFFLLPGTGLEVEMQTANDALNCIWLVEESPPLQ